MSGYLLIRRLPTGEITARLATAPTVRSAARWASRFLADVVGCEVSTAIKFEEKFLSMPVGTIKDAPGGYAFRILTADFTSNNVPITPGLRVVDYNRKLATVDAAQFMDDGMLMPGGNFFDHWYYTLRPGEDRPRARFNGERMTTDLTKAL